MIIAGLPRISLDIDIKLILLLINLLLYHLVYLAMKSHPKISFLWLSSWTFIYESDRNTTFSLLFLLNLFFRRNTSRFSYTKYSTIDNLQFKTMILGNVILKCAHPKTICFEKISLQVFVAALWPLWVMNNSNSYQHLW